MGLDGESILAFRDGWRIFGGPRVAKVNSTVWQ
jgi:hypothetical protein